MKINAVFCLEEYRYPLSDNRFQIETTWKKQGEFKNLIFSGGQFALLWNDTLTDFPELLKYAEEWVALTKSQKKKDIAIFLQKASEGKLIEKESAEGKKEGEKK